MRELFANLIAEAKRLPWWAWLLIAAAAYLGFRLVTGGSSSQDSSSDPLAGVLEGGPSSSGDTSSSDGALPTLSGNPLPDFSGANDGSTTSSGDDNIINTPSRVIAQGWDIHDANQESANRLAASNAAQALRSRQQGADIRAANADAASRLAASNAAQASRSRQQGADIRAYNQAQPAPKPKAAPIDVQLRRQAAAGVGGGPDSHKRGHGKSEPVYTMRRGEDLYSVADRLGVPADDLYAANRDRIDAAIREAGLTGMGIYAMPAIGDGLELIIPAAAL